MTENALCETIQFRDWMITPEQVLSGELEHLCASGLQVVSLCNDGTGRSRTVAQTLSQEYSIPSVRLAHGLRGLNDEEGTYAHCKSYLFSLLNQMPYLVVILTHQELIYYAQDVNHLRASRHQDSHSAIQSVRTRHSS